MKNKHLVYQPNMDQSGKTGWYCGNSSFIRGVTGPFTETKEDATWLTQKQAKVLIDSMRHRKYDVKAEPSFTIVY